MHKPDLVAGVSKTGAEDELVAARVALEQLSPQRAQPGRANWGRPERSNGLGSCRGPYGKGQA